MKRGAMIATFRRLGERLFPDRSIILCSRGSARTVTLGGGLQAAVLAVALVGLGGIGYGAAHYVHSERTLHHQISEMATLAHTAASKVGATRVAYDDLRRQLDDANERAASLTARYASTSAQYDATRQQLDATRQQLDQTRHRLATLNTRLGAANSERTSLKSTLAEAEANAKSLNTQYTAMKQHLVQAVDESKQNHHGEMELTALRNRLSLRESELAAANAHSTELKRAVDTMDRQLLEMAFERDRLRAQLGQPPEASNTPGTTDAGVKKTSVPAPAAVPEASLQKMSFQNQKSPAETTEPAKLASAPETALGSAPNKAAAPVAAASRTSELERLIASTGVDINRLLGSLSVPSGEGGPYVALSSVKLSPAIEQKRMVALRKLVKNMPLRSPLVHYQLESGFGPRIDPINHRASFHPGLDLAAPYRSPVYSTGPGVVSFTGVKGAYGREVEIDHGHGLVTRYAHLHRILVARGQHVAAHQEIGQLGSTGRSTGPHVHYEILFDGTPLDPAKFMKVGKNVVEVTSK